MNNCKNIGYIFMVTGMLLLAVPLLLRAVLVFTLISFRDFNWPRIYVHCITTPCCGCIKHCELREILRN